MMEYRPSLSYPAIVRKLGPCRCLVEYCMLQHLDVETGIPMPRTASCFAASNDETDVLEKQEPDR